MARPLRRARRRDRDAVVDALAIAFSEDQLTAKEHERRVERALKAVQVSALVTQLKDLQLHDDHPAATLVRAAPPTPTREPPAPKPPRMQPKQRRRWLLGIGAAFTVLVGGSVISAWHDEQSNFDFQASELSSLERFVADAEEELGTTEVLFVTFHSEYADVAVAAKEGDGRFERYYYDDDGFTQQDFGLSVGDNDPDLVDLADVDLGQLVANRKVAVERSGVEDGEVERVRVGDDYDKPLSAMRGLDYDTDVEPWVEFRVTNRFNETAEFVTDPSGDRVLGESPYRSP